MNNCKACNKPIEGEGKRLLGEFCNENCFWSYQGEPELPTVDDERNIPLHFKIIRDKVKKNKKFFISNTTLTPYLSLNDWSKFLVKNDFMVVRLNEELSVIKKSIL